MEECMKVFAQRIKELRIEKDLTVRMLAEKLNISHAAISYYENCHREATLSVLNLYSKFFDVSLDYLMGISDERGKYYGKD
jgi:transcriptional regulator with XRE-family HTH domain